MRPRRLLWALTLSLFIHLGTALGLRDLRFGPRPLPPLVVELVAPVVTTLAPERLMEEAAPRGRTAAPPAPPAGDREAGARAVPIEIPAEAPLTSTHSLPPAPLREPEERLVGPRAPSAPAPAPPAEPAVPPQPTLGSLDRLVASAPIPEPSKSPPPAPSEAALPPAGSAVQASPSVPSPPAPSELTAAAPGEEPRRAMEAPKGPRGDSNRGHDGGGGGAGEPPALSGGVGDRPGGPSREPIGDGAGGQGAPAGAGGEFPRLAALPGGSQETGEYRAYLEAFRRKIQESLVYPSAALRRQLQGTVRLEVRLRETGEVAGVGLLHSSGHAILDEAAVRTVEAAGPFPFPPGLRRRPLTVQLPIVFELR